jgi:DNA mismatch repair protein MutS
MLRQYYAAKAEHPGVLMAIRIGDFYEFYGDDADQAAAVLEITLTGREDGSNGRISMAGVPHHSVEKYLARLVQAGHKVALCDQVEDPKTAKGLVRRAVTRVFTPGTLLEDSMLSAGQNNFLAAICFREGKAGLATLDPSTGEFLVTEVTGERLGERVVQELARIRPRELLLNPDAAEIGQTVQSGLGVALSEADAPDAARAARKLLDQFHTSSLEGFGCEDKPSAVVAASMILKYAEQNRLDLAHVDSLSTYSVDGFMAIDPNTRRSLELTQNLADGGRKHTLLSVLDETVTSMGSRLMRRWIEQPLLELEPIRSRHAAVARMVEANLPRADVRDQLRKIADLERLVSRCATGYATPRDLASLAASLGMVPMLKEVAIPVALGRIAEVLNNFADLRELAMKLDQALAPDPPLTLRDGGVIRDGFNEELDRLRRLSRDGKGYIASLETQERETTGISQLKVGYNSVFGYFFEVSKQHSHRVPDHYIRKQTTANAERYITAELKEQESAVLGATEKSVALESDLFHRLRLHVAEHSHDILKTARAIAELDVLAGLGEVAVRRGYVRPEMVEEDVFDVSEGRHAVVEANGPAFVPNDLEVGGASGMRLMILTGPNMSGKSTFLRQNALIALLAQIGSFVPAKSARLGLCDAIFARIGAKDELALGQSTFMVEMLESAYILHHATPRSLVVLDEVGRGTSTFDGLAIAWAMIERLAEIGAKTMFATHYHQLNVLADDIPVIRNYRVSVQEIGDQVVWTHRVLAGGTDRSYGIHVARAAGMPSAVLHRAASILAELENQSERPKTVSPAARMQLTLFEAEEPAVVQELRGLDVESLTPLQALQWLDQWKQKVGK